MRQGIPEGFARGGYAKGVSGYVAGVWRVLGCCVSRARQLVGCGAGAEGSGFGGVVAGVGWEMDRKSRKLREDEVGAVGGASDWGLLY